MNCLALSLLASKLSSSAALVLLDEWPLDSILVRIACTMDDRAWVAASVVSLWASRAQSLRELLAI